MSFTLFIVLANALVSITALNNRDLFLKLDFQPYLIQRNNQWYRFISHAFVHADWGHLAVNMYVLYQFGKLVETYYEQLFPGMWQVYFVLLYLGGILFSTIPGYARNKENFNYHGVGASGAVSAVVFSFILMEPMAPLGIIFIPISMPAIVFGLLYLALEVYLDRNRKSNIAHSAHYFGGLFGVVFTVLIEPELVLQYLR
ncbi:MAG: rhomboid family intramembrane serine protease [Flavobacteriales bacterium]|jgi:membrane associated rhomboid family serine protease|nr:rhomboid family intramembrane serine protease [Flavobacteriales bacterium]MBT3963559.1 rhomboid family intramembrane serine protease [Flavobacteriales bacterium]MBT4704371.1 rhomboid family intramembrane serine protease [Flavobacteriales bacterium]MBT4930473.1 rhomboid family intramembrane serine protease [Flavobacteriales bacterium]MBT5131749.1 rhomboid family intramembrane serine protease [Flavobacteriales bacterium]